MTPAGKGRLKIYLGYAAGVGKTYRMLDEARTMREHGADIVIGYFEPHGRKETIAKTEGLAAIPRRTLSYGGSQFEEMDTGAILRRHPAVAIVDEFAHTNVPGSERTKRWQDVRVLLDAGIDVLTTMNVQHLESLNDQVWHVTGVRVRETVPDWVVDEADEVILVDLTPRALRNRLERGVVYAHEKAHRAMESFFTEANLTALREMALRHTAHEVEEKLTVAAERKERLLICLTGRPASANLIRRAKRVADYLQAGCVAVHVASDSAGREAAERHLSFARNLRIETHVLEGDDVALTIAEFARRQAITQIFMGRSLPPAWWNLFGETIVQRVVRHARDMQVTIVAERRVKNA
ncbi:MAG TPA: sensor histidine kinase KdpD [Candidatus Sulfopaludibacter sp.]|jgi:two-component system sensor histidine kinase KdpD|nr:sensor histidine kinase KdpD [Candidatus Sulfopaludibacter sp.]